MKTTRTQNLLAAVLAGALAAATTQAQTVETRIGKLDFVGRADEGVTSFGA